MLWGTLICSPDFLLPSLLGAFSPLPADFSTHILGVSFICKGIPNGGGHSYDLMGLTHLFREGVPPGKAGYPGLLSVAGPATLGAWLHLL